MHNCEEFRERITEHIIDREDLTADPRFRPELLICSDCCEFYVDSREMLSALAAVDASIGPVDVIAAQEWERPPIPIPVSVSLPVPRMRKRPRFGSMKWAAAVAALLVISIGLLKFPPPRRFAPVPTTYVEQPVPLDPVTVDFLQQSELLLRNVAKMTPTDTQDLADVKRMASEQLLVIDQRKDATAHLPPVLNVMDTYETVLRDIRNVDETRAADDVPDIQSRIQHNGLIANIKSFQPRVTPVSYGAR